MTRNVIFTKNQFHVNKQQFLIELTINYKSCQNDVTSFHVWNEVQLICAKLSNRRSCFSLLLSFSFHVFPLLFLELTLQVKLLCVINDGAVSQHKFGASSILFFNTELLFPLKQVKTLADMMTSPYFFITDDRQISGFFYTCNLVYSVAYTLEYRVPKPKPWFERLEKSICTLSNTESKLKSQFWPKMGKFN